MKKTPQELWLQIGMDNGFISNVVCELHDGTPISKQEDDDFELNLEPCLNIVRIYESKEHKKQIEANFPLAKPRNYKSE